MIYHYDAPPHDVHKPTETQQLEAEGVDWLYCFTGALVYASLIALTLWWLP